MIIRWTVAVFAFGLAGCSTTSHHQVSLDFSEASPRRKAIYACPDSSITVVFRAIADYHFTWWSEGLTLEITSQRMDTVQLDWTGIQLSFEDANRFSPSEAWVKHVRPLGLGVKTVEYDADWIPVTPRKTTVVGLAFSGDEKYLAQYWELRKLRYSGGTFFTQDSAVVCTLPTIHVHVDPEGNKLIRD